MIIRLATAMTHPIFEANNEIVAVIENRDAPKPEEICRMNSLSKAFNMPRTSAGHHALD